MLTRLNERYRMYRVYTNEGKRQSSTLELELHPTKMADLLNKSAISLPSVGADGFEPSASTTPL